MNTGLHALGWGLPRLAIALALVVFAALMTYATLIFVIVVVQAVASFGH
jgi:hypothetical protein